MKLRELQPGKVYAYSRDRNAKYHVDAVVFLGDSLYRERGSLSTSGPVFKKIEKPGKYDKPRAGEWGHGGVGYPVAFLEYRVPPTPEVLAVLRTASLEELESLTASRYPDASDDTRHKVIRYDLLTSLPRIKGEWEEFHAERKLREDRERAYHEEKAERQARIAARRDEALSALTDMGISGPVLGRDLLQSGSVTLSLGALEDVAAVVRWARSRGMRHMGQLRPVPEVKT